MAEIRKEKAHCNTCGGDTSHFLLHHDHRQWDMLDHDDEPIAHEREDYETIKCCGCEEIKLMITSSASFYPSYVTYHPPAKFRRQPPWIKELMLGGVMHEFRRNLHQMLGEVYAALQNDMPRLAAMGVRAILETIMLQEVGDHGTFQKNIDAFAAAGHIGTRQQERIKFVLDAGSAAIHRGYVPEAKDVIAMVDLTENLVESIYIHDAQIASLKSRTPPRPSIARSTSQNGGATPSTSLSPQGAMPTSQATSPGLDTDLPHG